MRPRVSRPFLLLSLLSLSLLPPCRSAPLDDFRQCVATPTQPADPVIGSTAALPAESGSLLTAADDGFAAAAATLNLNSQLLPPPAAIVYPTSTAQVARVVRCAVNASLPITVRGGAHSYISESSGGFKTAGVVIDLAGRGEGRGGMLKVDIDEAGGKAVVEAGNWLGRVYHLLFERGRYYLPAGNCPSVGLSGHALGGGLGYFARSDGYLSDHILEMTVVDARGDVLTVSSTIHPDLFWALKGSGGGNFGIVTSFTFALLKLPAQLVYVQQSWPIASSVGGSADLHARALAWFLERFHNVDGKLTSWWGSYGDWGTLTTLFLGSSAELAPILDPLLATAPPGWRESFRVETADWRDIVFTKIWGIERTRFAEVLARDSVITWSEKSWGAHKSAHLFPAHLPLSPSTLLPFINFRDTAPSRGLPKPHIQFHAGHPASGLRKRGDSAVAWRGHAHLLQYYSLLKTKEEYNTFVPFLEEWERVFAQVTASPEIGNATAFKYTNYIDLSGAQSGAGVFLDDPETGGLAKLGEVKARYDPEGVWSVLGGVPARAVTQETAATTATAAASTPTTTELPAGTETVAATSSRTTKGTISISLPAEATSETTKVPVITASVGATSKPSSAKGLRIGATLWVGLFLLVLALF